MAILNYSTIQSAILGTPNILDDNSHYWNPIESALTLLVNISGSHEEVYGYYNKDTSIDSIKKGSVEQILKSTAYQIFKEHDKITDLVTKHPFIKERITTGPLARLEREDQIIYALSSLMIDVSFYQELREKGYMDWDDGTYEAAMIVSYGWRKALPFKIKLTQSSAEVHFETRRLIRSALKKHPNNVYLQFVAQRYGLSWYAKNAHQLQQSTDYFQILARSRKRSGAAVAMKTLGQSSLVDLGLRYRNPILIKSSLKKLERNFTPAQKKQGMILFAKAWANVYSHKKTGAKTLALKMAKDKNPFLKQQAIHVLNTIGEEKKAGTLLKKFNLLTNK